MTKKEIKIQAQDIIMDTIAAAYYKIYEGTNFTHLSETEKNTLSAEVKKQNDRIAKMFGYNESWTV